MTKQEQRSGKRQDLELLKGDNMTQINLAAICDQLTEALGMEQPLKVAGLIEDNGELVGWTVVSISENGKMTPISAQYKTIKDLFAAYGE